MESWILKPFIKILKRNSSICIYIHTYTEETKELHIVRYNKDTRIWIIEWQMNENVFLHIEKKKIPKYFDAISDIILIEMKAFNC